MLQDKLSTIREEKAAEDRGFTLIELLVVVVIIGILIAIAIPLYLNYQKGAKDKSAQSDLRAAVSTLNQCYTDNANAYVVDSGAVASTTPPKVTFTCGTTSEVANLSSGTTLTYHGFKADGTTACTGADCAVFTLSASNSGGSKTYTYNSLNGGSIG